MGMAAILINGPCPFQHSFILLPQGGSTWNLSNIGPEASEKKSLEIINIFPIQMYGAHTNAYKSKRPRCKKVKCQCTTINSATLVDLPSLMICAKIQPQGIPGPGEVDF